MNPPRSPLTGPVALSSSVPAPGAAHWWPQFDEPVYSETYRDHCDRLFAGLLDGTIGDPAVWPC